MAFELRHPREYNGLTPILHKINREVVALKEDQKKRAVDVMNKVVRHVVQKLRSVNETFDTVYKDTRWVGSYFDGLRVYEPSEFDVNIVLQFPFYEKCKVEKSAPGYVQVCVEPTEHFAHVESAWNRRSVDWTLKQFIDEGGYFRQDKVSSWWQSMFSKAVSTSDYLDIDGQYYLVKWRSSGPAITLNVVAQGGPPVKMDIDMVPVLRFNNANASSPSYVYDSWLAETPFLPRPKDQKDWYIVPKPLKKGGPYVNRWWRLSFTDQEKVMIHGKDHLKPINRLLKRLRDNNDWKPLSSYFIKTVFLHESGRDIAFHRSNMGYLLVFILSNLRAHLKNQSLPFYWDPNMNLFSGRIEPPEQHEWGRWSHLEQNPLLAGRPERTGIVRERPVHHDSPGDSERLELGHRSRLESNQFSTNSVEAGSRCGAIFLRQRNLLLIRG